MRDARPALRSLALITICAGATARAQAPGDTSDDADSPPTAVAPKPDAAAAAPEPAPEPEPRAVVRPPGYLRGLAEAESPNEAIHVIERKTYEAAGRFEATLYPAALQLNSKFVNSDGVGVAVAYALQENFALQLLGLFNYLGTWAPLTGQLLDNNARPLAADQIILQGGAVGGFEVSPLYGKLAFYDGVLVHFRFVIDAGAGVGFTEVQLSGSTSKTPNGQNSFGSTGPRFLGNLGAGFRLLLGNRLALRLEVHDLLYTAKVDAIDGCNLSDIAAASGAGTTSGAKISAGCDPTNFVDIANNPQHATAATVAKSLLGDNSSDVVNDLVFFAGLSFLF
jgi:outer membrane beta-barrel protein